MKLLAILLLIIRCSAPVCWAQTGTEMLEKYQVRLHKIQIVSYDVQRIDTFPSGTVWNHEGHGILARSAKSKILKARFLVSRTDRASAYLYDGTRGYELDHKAKTYQLQPDPYAPSVQGDPNGQMLAEELLPLSRCTSK